jgi:hypothetical protein
MVVLTVCAAAGAQLHRVRAAAGDRAPEEAAPLVDATRAAALDALGDTDGAETIAERRLRVPDGASLTEPPTLREGERAGP